ncbi:MAG: hypothetical protein AAF205_05700, partial [Pseudomonadota bacterium]
IMNKKVLSALLAGSALAAPAMAAGTGAGQTISNDFQVTYTVGTADPVTVDTAVTGGGAEFLVDRKVDLTVVRVNNTGIDGRTVFTAGDTEVVTAFDVTNTSNETLDFRLALADVAGDDFDDNATNPYSIFVDTGSNTYESGTDTLNFIDELPADTTVRVFVVRDDPNANGAPPTTLNDGDLDDLTLRVFAAGSVGGTNGAYVTTSGALAGDLTETSGANDPDSIDTVFADDEVGDAKGEETATNGYQYSSATIALEKSSAIVWDPVNLTSNPKMIPGAVVEYCLALTNSGSQAATSVSFTDQVPVNVSPIPGANGTDEEDQAFRIGDSGCTQSDGALENPASGGNGQITTTGGTFGNGTVSATIASVPAPTGGATEVVRTVRFKVTID